LYAYIIVNKKLTRGFDMKTVFITGASTGIGKETAKLFQAKGWNVVATMRKPNLERELTKLKNIKVLM
jgi:NAD(P)-dependent dehydrogenase (short-subunit alcohol dehydrogenase family)